MTQPTPATGVLASIEPTGILTGQGLVKSYDGSPALRGVDFCADRGEIVAITGPSGSGKSTLLLCLAGILTPDAGAVSFAGERVDQAGETRRSQLRRTVFGVLFQFGHLVPELTAVENVAIPLLLTGTRRREATRIATGWLDRFDVAELATKRPTQMSGGQAQRVAAARAMVTEPEVLFTDEPTGSLDTLAGEQMMLQLTQAVRTTGTTLLLVTHDAKVAAYADREVVIRDGLSEEIQ